jgi:polyisoprenoid-binding protein YceI
MNGEHSTVRFRTETGAIVMKKSVLASFVVLLGISTILRADTYKVDPAHSFIIFKVSHLGVSNAWGRFDGPTGTIEIDAADPSKTRFDVEAKTDKVDTGNQKRDTHLKSADFFNARQFPTLSFKTESVTKSGDDAFEVTGNLTVHGVTKPLTVTMKKIGAADTQNGARAGFEGHFTVKRSDFGMTNMVGPVGDEVQVWVSLEGVKE